MPANERLTKNHNLVDSKFFLIWFNKENLALQKYVRKTYEFTSWRLVGQLAEISSSGRPFGSVVGVCWGIWELLYNLVIGRLWIMRGLTIIIPGQSGFLRLWQLDDHKCINFLLLAINDSTNYSLLWEVV